MSYIEQARKLDKLADDDSKGQEVHRLVESAAQELADDRIERGVEALVELAFFIATHPSAGGRLYKKRMFESQRRIAVARAIRLGASPFVEIRLREMEQKMYAEKKIISGV